MVYRKFAKHSPKQGIDPRSVKKDIEKIFKKNQALNDILLKAIFHVFLPRGPNLPRKDSLEERERKAYQAHKRAFLKFQRAYMELFQEKNLHSFLKEFVNKDRQFFIVEILDTVTLEERLSEKFNKELKKKDLIVDAKPEIDSEELKALIKKEYNIRVVSIASPQKRKKYKNVLAYGRERQYRRWVITMKPSQPLRYLVSYPPLGMTLATIKNIWEILFQTEQKRFQNKMKSLTEKYMEKEGYKYEI